MSDAASRRIRIPIKYQYDSDGRCTGAAAGPFSDEAGTEWTGNGTDILRTGTPIRVGAIADADPKHRHHVQSHAVRSWSADVDLSLVVKLPPRRTGLL